MRASCGWKSPLSKAELEEIAKQCVSLSQLRESYVNLTITRELRSAQGCAKDLSKLTAQVYAYAIPYLWAFPPHEQIFGTSCDRAAAPRPAGGTQHGRPDREELPVG